MNRINARRFREKTFNAFKALGVFAMIRIGPWRLSRACCRKTLCQSDFYRVELPECLTRA